MFDDGDPRHVDPLDEQYGQRFIAAVGIDRYQDPAWPRLNNAVRDAQGALRAFQRLGFAPIGEPLCDEAATVDAMKRLVTDDLAKLGTRDSLIVFFAGHGHNMPRTFDEGDTRTTGFLIPVDGHATSAARWLRLDHWLSDIALLKPKHILVVLDACYTGIALDALIKWRAQARRTESLAYMARRRSRQVITSARGDQRAMDSGPLSGHSLFTGCLIEALDGRVAGPGEIVTSTELALHIRDRVTSYPRSLQTPDFGALEEDRRGELIFRIPGQLGELSSAQEPASKPPAEDRPPAQSGELPTAPELKPPAEGAPPASSGQSAGAVKPGRAARGERADLAVLVALDEEFEQLVDLGGLGPAMRDADGGYYFPFEIASSGDKYRCVAKLIGDRGISAARGSAERMLDRWRPATAVALGIAAGLHDDVKLGDLVVASQIDEYETRMKAVAASGHDGFEFEHSGRVFHCEERLIAALRDLSFAHATAVLGFQAACGADAEQLLSREEWIRLQRNERMRRSPLVVRGHLASGSIVGATAAFAAWLHRRDRSIIALEMESAALAAAAAVRTPPVPVLALRGVSDFGDERKKAIDAINRGAVRRYAMRNAVRYLLLLAQLGALPRHKRKAP